MILIWVEDTIPSIAHTRISSSLIDSDSLIALYQSIVELALSFSSE